MSLATRCGQCGTVFRVVEDQLKVSEGWVRCGRCEAVFNALESLFDLDREPPPPWPPAEPAPPEPDDWPDEPAGTPATASQRGPLEPPPFEPSELPSDGSSSAHLEHRPLLHEPGDDGHEVDRRFQPTHPPHLYDDDPLPDPPMFPPSAPLPLRESAPDLPPPAAAPLVPPPLPATAPAVAAGAPEAPEFVRQADRSARWQRPGLRVPLALLALLLVLLLVGQVGVRWRDTLAARWPESASALRALCRIARCEVEPLRRVDSLAVDNSGLVKLEGNGNHYRFDVTVRNHDRVAVMLPHFELTLTDAQGLVVARKVLSPAELGSSATTLAPGGTLALQGVLTGGERKLSGYTVEIFYP